MKTKENKLSFLTNGIIKENPVFVLVLGTCPTLAVTTSIIGAFSMGIAAMVVLICSNMVISALRNIIPDKVRIPCYIVVIAGFVTIVSMVMHAYLPELYDMLGLYLALIVVNCIILGRAEMFASKHTVAESALDGVGMGIGFTLALLSMALIREVIGNGTFMGMAIPYFENFTINIFKMAPGGFMVFGFMIAIVNYFTKGRAIKKKDFGCEGCPNMSACSGGCETCKKEGE